MTESTKQRVERAVQRSNDAKKELDKVRLELESYEVGLVEKYEYAKLKDENAYKDLLLAFQLAGINNRKGYF